MDEEDNIFKIYVENKKLNNQMGCINCNGSNFNFGWCGCTLLPGADDDLKKYWKNVNKIVFYKDEYGNMVRNGVIRTVQLSDIVQISDKPLRKNIFDKIEFYLLFEFDNEEELFYFKLKYC